MSEGLLYLTADGLLQPLGFSQVVRVVEALAQRGWPYELFSLERKSDIAQRDRVDALGRRLARSGIRWRFAPYADSGGGRDAADNELRLIEAALAHDGAGTHCRAYHGGVAGLAAWIAKKTPYLFDTRSYWFDERLEEGRWFTTPIRLGVARGIEHQLFSHASGVVTLTELQAEDVRTARVGSARQRVVRCITTCADFDDFTVREAAELPGIPEQVRSRLTGRRVLGIVGSLNRSYLADETMALASKVLAREPNFHLLILSAQQAEYEALVARVGIDATRVTITRANHDAMPQWLALVEWGLLLLNPSSPAKRASMPTKLGEFFASGVRPIQFGCNAEVAEWVSKTGSGIVLEEVSDPALDAAASRIVGTPRDLAVVRRARELAAPHFSLSFGIDKYEQVLLASFGDLRRA